MEIRFDSTGVPGEELSKAREAAAGYMARLRDVAARQEYSEPESSLRLPSDDGYLGRIEALAAEKSTPALKHVFVIGIGGSNLGTQAIYDTSFLHRDKFDPGSAAPKAYFLDTVSERALAEASALVSRLEDPGEVAVVVISKSGTTMETAVNFEAVRGTLERKFGAERASGRIVAITNSGSSLYASAAERGISTIEMPDKVGGRYSVFSAVGLVPLALLGFDVRAIAAKAAVARDESLRDDGPALATAISIFRNMLAGRDALDTFLFAPELESLGKWRRQLVAESLGKTNTSGERVGITPTVSIGSTDLHSVAQLYIGGPRDKQTTLVSLPPLRAFNDAYGIDLGKDGSASVAPSALIPAIYEGVKATYRNEGMPFAEAMLGGADDIPSLMQHWMVETMILGHLMGVNAFDQPAVELYKAETRNILAS